MRALLLRKGKKEVDRREGRGGKGRGRDLPDRCQSASYAPATASINNVKSNKRHREKTDSIEVYTDCV